MGKEITPARLFRVYRSLGCFADDAVDGLGEVVQVIRVEAGHGDAAVLRL